MSPLELLRLGREEVAAYGGRVISGRVAQVHRDGEEFSVVTEDWQRVRARRVLVTTGLVDELPEVPGLAERWGAMSCTACTATVGRSATGRSACSAASTRRCCSGSCRRTSPCSCTRARS
ncbi:hypothetical protein NKH18_02675 [Streptomyces sp. M10(2022)]